MGLILMKWLPRWNIQPGLYAMCAAAAMLGGVFRSSISLVVIVVEGTQVLLSVDPWCLRLGGRVLGMEPCPAMQCPFRPGRLSADVNCWLRVPY